MRGIVHHSYGQGQKPNVSQVLVDYLLPPAIAFIIVGLVNLALIKSNAFWASVILSFPTMEISLFIVLALMHRPLSQSNLKTFGGTCGTAAIGMILTIGWLLTMYYLLYVRSDVTFWPAIGMSTSTWALLLLIYMFVMCGSPIAINNCINVGGSTHFIE